MSQSNGVGGSNRASQQSQVQEGQQANQTQRQGDQFSAQANVNPSLMSREPRSLNATPSSPAPTARNPAYANWANVAMSTTNVTGSDTSRLAEYQRYLAQQPDPDKKS